MSSEETEFVTANGRHVWLDADGVVCVKPGYDDFAYTQALREFFQHERDEELGRWRWLENPDYVVYPLPSPDGRVHIVEVFSERFGQSVQYPRDYFRSTICSRNSSPEALAASDYFAAHPEPKPWHDAKPGESWVLRFESGEELSQTVNFEGDFYPWVLPVTSDAAYPQGIIVDGWRVWPETDV